MIKNINFEAISQEAVKLVEEGVDSLETIEKRIEEAYLDSRTGLIYEGLTPAGFNYIGSTMRPFEERIEWHRIAVEENREYRCTRKFREEGFHNVWWRIITQGIENRKFLNKLESFYILVRDGVGDTGLNSSLPCNLTLSEFKHFCGEIPSKYTPEQLYQKQQIVRNRIALYKKEKIFEKSL